METNHTTTENFNDLVFENRNKAYGAYAIRNAYNDNVSTALFIALLLSGTFALISFLFNKNEKIVPFEHEQIVFDELFTIDVTPKEEVYQEKIEEAKPPQDNTPKSDNLTMVASDNKDDVVTTTNDDAAIIQDGKPDGDSAYHEPKEPKETHGTMTVVKNPNEIERIVAEMPEFSGNLIQFLSNKIKYPYRAIDIGTSGTVVLQFVVEKDGSIDNINVLKSVPDGCTEEAIRVVKSMPKWKPGRNEGGEPVRVLFNLPVKFTLK